MKKQTAPCFTFIPVPKWLHGLAPETEVAISQTMTKEFTRLMQREGLRAFEMPRSAACAHETGHAIVETVLGRRVKSVQIHVCPGIPNAWGGVTRCHGDEGWGITEDTPAREIRHRIYRLIAGFAGEMVLDPDNGRSGSSLDERVVARMITVYLHQREGRSGHPCETWSECLDWVLTAIKLNEGIGRQLAARLDAETRVKGKPLDAILRRCGGASLAVSPRS